MTGNVDGGEARFGADSSADVFVAALLEAGPEAAEHLLKAAQELLLAAKAVVDAGERALDAHRSSSTGADPAADQRATGEWATDEWATDERATDERASAARESGLRRIDLA